MKYRFGTWAPLGLTLVLSACGGSDYAPSRTGGSNDMSPRLTVDDLAAGSYTVSVGRLDAPTVGRYYAGADGSRLLVLMDDNDRASRWYRRAAGAAWVGVPTADKDLTVTLLRSGAVPLVTPTATALAGTYVAQVAAGVTARFSVGADGNIATGASACQLSGKLSAGSLPNTLKLDLVASGCAGLPATSTGVLTAHTDDAPARLRLLADNNGKMVDLRAYAE